MKKAYYHITLLAFAFAFLLSNFSIAQCGSGQSSVTMTMDFTSDSYPDEDGWILWNVTDGVKIDSACFGTYTSTLYNKVWCLDTGKIYRLEMLDDYGDGLDGAVYSLDYTYAGNIGTAGSNNFNIAHPFCNANYANNELADTLRFPVNYVAPPACLAPINLSISSVNTNQAIVSWTETNSATEWEISYGAPGFTAGLGTQMLTIDYGDTLSGLTSSTSYDWYVRSICGAGDTSSWSAAGSFTTSFACPAGAVCATFSAGNISSKYGFTTLPGFSDCPDSVQLNIPGGNRIDSITTFYDMTAFNGAYMSEQRSYLYCSQVGLGESNLSIGSGGSAGTFSYLRNGLTFANGATGTVNITMHAGRSWGGSACDEAYNYVVNNTWTVVAYYGPIPACVEPNTLSNSAVTSNSADVNWNEAGTATQWQVSYGTTGFTAGNGTQMIANSKPFSLSGLSSQTGYDWYVRAICGAGDTSSWSLVNSFTTACAPYTAPFTESFNGTSTPNCWSQSATLGGPWLFGTPGFTWNTSGCAASTPADHTGNAGNYASLDFSGSGETDVVLEMNDIDVSGVTNPLLSFYFQMCGTGYSPINSLNVDAWNGSTWNTIATIQEETGGWKKYEFLLNAYVYNSDFVRIRFSANSNGSSSMFYGDMAIDDISVIAGPTCPPPSNLTTYSPGASSIGFSWTEANTASNWEVSYGATSFTVGTGTQMLSANDSTTLTGLSAGTTYDVYVRAICGSGDSSTWTGPYTFFFAGLPLSGTYTINAGAATSGTNFASFADFTATLTAAGISGPITANVVAASGPYNEQVIFNTIPGASSTNTVTVNGNGDTISYAPISTDMRIVGFDGAKHITLDNLVILGTSATYGFGVHFMNASDSNTVSNCTIDLSAITSTSSANSTGILTSSGINSTSGDGLNGDYLIIDNNNIIGGADGGAYYGIYLNGNGVTANGFGNQITNNTITNFYAYAIYIDDQEDLLIEGNDVSREDRLNPTTGYGVYVTSVSSQNVIINANAFHGFHNGDLTPTGATYAIYHSGNDAAIGKENKVTNNLIYDINSTGTIYAIYNSSSDNIHYYNNTISLDDVNATGGTTRGFYQTTLATGIEFKNNNISITRGGTGAKHAIYLGTTTSTVSSNYNNLYVNAPAGTNSVGYYSGDMTTLTDWKAANTSAYDQNSKGVNPGFLSTSNLVPSVSALNGAGTNVGLTTDYNGVARSTPPDIGAYEFTPPSCLFPTLSYVSNPTGNTIDVTWVDPGGVPEWQISYDTTGFTAGTGTQDLANNTPYTLSGLSIGTTYDVYLRSICGEEDTSAWSAVLTFYFAGPPMSGVYTVNSGAATAGTNFNNFHDLLTSLNIAGIGDPITVNVVAASGPYNEQVIFTEIPGASSGVRVTINGNGEKISYSPNSSDYRIVGFDGANYITLNNLYIEGTNSTYGFGVHFMNSSDTNTIQNCTIDLSAITSTSSSNSAGIITSSGMTSVTGDGNNASYLTIQNNVIRGGAAGGPYSGIYLNGNGTTNNGFGNQLTNNTILDFYSYGIYIDDQEDMVINDNDLSRPNLVNTTTAYCIYIISGATQNSVIYGNAIHGMFDGDPTPTSAVYGIYSSSNDATTGKENFVFNNLFYDNKSTGTIYGIYNSGSDNVRYYHNTISIDDASATTGTTRGFYQTTAATGIEFKNNIISITRGGTGTKHGIYLGTTTSTVASDYNSIYVNSPAGTNYYGYYGGNMSSFANWQAANSSAYDQNSVDANPGFLGVANPTPTSAALDSAGTNLGISTDFNGVTRNNPPDIGAIEFTPPSCLPVSSISVGTITSSSASISWTNSGSEISWIVEYGPTGYTAGTGSSTAAGSNPFTITGLSGSTTYDVYVRAVCGGGNSPWAGPASFTTACSAQSVPYTENFDNGGAIPNCWNQGAGNSEPWLFGTGGAATYGPTSDHTSGSGYYAWIDDSSPHNTATSLESPTLDLSGVSVPQLEFYLWSEDHGGTPSFPLTIEVDSGNGYAVVATFDIENTGWEKQSVLLSAYAGKTVSIKIRGDEVGTSFYKDIAIDDFSIVEAPTCPNISGLSATAFNLSTVAINWTSNGSETEWEIAYGYNSDPIANGLSSITSNNPDTITGLTSNTTVYFAVRAICSPGDTSGWSSVINTYTGYCIPAPSSQDNSGITNISFGSVNNPTGSESGYYGDYSGLSSDVERGLSYNLDITYSTGFTYVTEVWIDWNDDLDFDDLNENVYSGVSLSTNPTTLNASFTVPANAPLGQHRMRIGGADTGPPTPCYTGTYGSFEDYSVNVLPLQPCDTISNLRVQFLSDTSATIRWDTVAGATYKIVWKEAGTSGFNDVIFRQSNVGKVDVEGLNPDTRYVCVVTSNCKAGWSAGVSVRFKTLNQPCEIPTNIQTTGIQTDRARFEWDSMPGAVKYRIRYKASGDLGWTATAVSGTRTKKWITGLTPATNYEWQVKTVCEVGTTASGTKWSAVQNFTTTASARIKFMNTENHEVSNSISVFPNPNNGNFEIRIEQSEAINYQLEVVDMVGKTVYQTVLKNDLGRMRTPIHLGNQPKGVYFLRFNNGKEVKVDRIVIN